MSLITSSRLDGNKTQVNVSGSTPLTFSALVLNGHLNQRGSWASEEDILCTRTDCLSAQGLVDFTLTSQRRDVRSSGTLENGEEREQFCRYQMCSFTIRLN